jgi:dienelactone hydrolase/uncharacterized protein (DUF2141 family)
MRQFAWGRLLFWLACASVPAFAQSTGTVTLTVKGLHSSKGNVAASLCADPKAQFPGPCADYSAISPAKEGATTLTFTGVSAGNYALQLFHDENGNSIPEIPPEGFGFGNDEPFPPDFAKASIKVAGDTATSVNVVYFESNSAAPQRSADVAVPAGVAKTDVRDDGLFGELYIPVRNGSVRHGSLPALIVLGGSEGGVQTASRVGVAFTGHGYAVLALAYFREAGLPQTLENVPLEYFETALDWLKKQPGIDGGAIGVMGGSRGSEAALLLASRRRDVRAVMAFAPSGVVWQGLSNDFTNTGAAWTAAGKAVPFLIPDGAAYRPNAMRKMFDNALLAADQRPEVAIPVEKIHGPILLLSGRADALWPSTDMSGRLVKRLQDRGFKHSVQHLSYEGAGHLVFIGDPTRPAAQAMAMAAPNAMLGGTGAANAAAWADNWPKTLAFFDKALKRTR